MRSERPLFSCTPQRTHQHTWCHQFESEAHASRAGTCQPDLSGEAMSTPTPATSHKRGILHDVGIMRAVCTRSRSGWQVVLALALPLQAS